METRYESLTNLFKDPAVAQRLLTYSPEEAVAVLQEEYHLEFTAEELVDVAEGIKTALNEASDELTDDQLEDVVGGGKGSTAYNAGYYIGKTVKVVGVVAGILVVATGTW